MDVLNQLGQFNQNFLLANCLWGTVASGYLIYGWRRRSLIPFLGGFCDDGRVLVHAGADDVGGQHCHHVCRLVAGKTGLLILNGFNFRQK